MSWMVLDLLRFRLAENAMPTAENNRSTEAEVVVMLDGGWVGWGPWIGEVAGGGLTLARQHTVAWLSSFSSSARPVGLNLTLLVSMIDNVVIVVYKA